MLQVDISNKPSPHSLGQRLARVAWSFAYVLLFRPSPRPLHRWRLLLLQAFGASVTRHSRVGPKAIIWAPWNLRMSDHSTIADDVIVYCVAPVTVGPHATVSQFSHLCAATHDFEHPRFPLVPAPIEIGAQCWIATDVFVGPGVEIGEGSVVGARSSVFSSLPPWKVCVGSPARAVRPREIGEDTPHVNLSDRQWRVETGVEA